MKPMTEHDLKVLQVIRESTVEVLRAKLLNAMCVIPIETIKDIVGSMKVMIELYDENLALKKRIVELEKLESFAQ